MKTTALRAAPYAAVILAVGLSIAAQAQTPMPDPLDDRSVRRLDKMEKVVRELRAIVFQGRDTGRPVVVQDAETTTVLSDLNERVVSLEQTLTQLNQSNDSLTSELEKARRALETSQAENASIQQKLAGLDTRLAALEGAREQADAEAATQAEEAALDPNTLFTRGRELMNAGDYDAAEGIFTRFTERFGDDPKAPEANYWLGKTLTARGANSEAAGAYLRAIRGWPKVSWGPDATVELARALTAQRLNAEACQILSELPRQYPKAPPAVMSRANAARTAAACQG